MMVLYRRKYIGTPVYTFVGSEHVWRKFIIDHIPTSKQIYLLDCEANRRLYPPEIKVITSSQTIKRVNFTNLNKSIIFVGETKQRDFLTMNWNSANKVVLRTSFQNLVRILADGLLEEKSKKTVRFLKRYK
jgi:hypothetical protein